MSLLRATVAGTDRARQALAGLPGAADRASVRALNRAAIAGRQRAVEEITQRYAVRQSDVRSKIRLSTATAAAPVVVISLASPSLSLAYFPHSPKAPGTGGPGRPTLTVEVKRGQTKAVKGAFVAKVASGLRIFRRTGSKTATGGDELTALRSVSLAGMLGVSDVRQAVEERALEVYEQRLDHEIARELSR